MLPDLTVGIFQVDGSCPSFTKSADWSRFLKISFSPFQKLYFLNNSNAESTGFCANWTTA